MSTLSTESEESEESELPFAALGAPLPLARALAERGYQTPTAVQAAVLAAPARDLLVSSHTGSGKTVAFGLVLGRVLLGDEERLAPPLKPRALVIAPTRELAAQVERELTWLLGPAGARLCACTGGTDARGDVRALHRGAHIVVGTPGRLVDLASRKTLDLSGLEAVVLDEADEMLDLGFREPLEALLDAAPATRRTLLFSATLPPAIQGLARRYQREALPLDPRPEAAAAHDDIEHVAHLCADGERLPALVNVLRLRRGGDERALVFCRTRDDVAELHRQLTARGFHAAYLSGERAQAERTRALESLRHGRVRVLVATNVAARGLDLPELGLVVHSDLPDSAEALTHRAGRTGRAGKKGVNVFLVEAGARRRAERLFAAAGLALTWTAPPTAAAIAARDRDELGRALTAAAVAPPSSDASALAAALLAGPEAATLVATLIDRVLAAEPAGEPLTPVSLPSARGHAHAAGKGAAERAPRGAREADSRPMALFQVNLGAKDRAEANWILPLVCRRGGITRRDVGAIRVARDRTYFEIAAEAAAEFAASAAERDPRAPHVRIERAADELPAANAGGPGRARARAWASPARPKNRARGAHRSR